MIDLLADFCNLLPPKLSLRMPEPILRRAYAKLWGKYMYDIQLGEELQLEAQTNHRSINQL